MAAADPVRPAGDRDWDDAACGLLELDGRRRIVRANARFLTRTGYSAADVERGLRWADVLTPASRMFFETQLSTMLSLNGALEEILLELVGPDGQRLPALVNAEAVPDGSGTVRLAVMSVPDRKAYEAQLRDARLRAERSERAGEIVRARLELTARANSALVSSLDIDTALAGLARVLVGEVADWCLVYAVDPDQEVTVPRWAGAHADPALQTTVEQLARLLPRFASPESSLSRALAGAAPTLLADISVESLRDTTTSEDVLDLYRVLDPTSAIVVPSHARAQQAAVIVLVRSGGRAPFTEADLDGITDLASRTGVVIDNLRLYAREHSISIVLQNALLTPTPDVGNLDIATRYVPGANGNEIGGDWYDAFSQADGTTVLVIGDVVGHDIDAAATMGQLRGVLRTIAHTASGTAAQALEQADRIAAGLQLDAVASAVVVRVPRAPRGTDDEVRIEWASAGHPPPVLVRAGTATVLTDGPDPLLGVVPGRRRHDHHLTMRAGDTLLLYTDGLVERRDEDIDVSIAQLAERLSVVGPASPDELCESALSARPPGSTDDVALLAFRVRADPSAR